MSLQDDLKILDGYLTDAISIKDELEDRILDIQEQYQKIILNHGDDAKRLLAGFNLKMQSIEVDILTSQLQNLEHEITQANYNIQQGQEQKNSLIRTPKNNSYLFHRPRGS